MLPTQSYKRLAVEDVIIKNNLMDLRAINYDKILSGSCAGNM